MRVRNPYVIITFRTTTEAMAMESKCGQKGIPGRLIPIPREITAGCGLAWRIGVQEYKEYKEAIDALSIAFEQQVELEI